MVVVVDSCLAGVEFGGWDPFGAAVFADAGAPVGVFDEEVVGFAGQGEFVDVGLPALDPVPDGVMHLAAVRRDVAAGLVQPPCREYSMMRCPGEAQRLVRPR